jgi:hypothetical protein
MHSNTCFRHVFVIAGLMSPFEQGSGKCQIKCFCWIKLAVLGNVERLNVDCQIVGDLLYSSIATALYLSYWKSLQFACIIISYLW